MGIDQPAQDSAASGPDRATAVDGQIIAQRSTIPCDPASPSAQWAPFVVRPDTDLRDLKRQYRHLAASHHPDHGGDPGTMARINQLYSQLTRHYSSIA